MSKQRQEEVNTSNTSNTIIAEKIIVENSADGVSCDGGGGALGHPKVWYNFDGGNSVECGYCDRIFVKVA